MPCRGRRADARKREASRAPRGPGRRLFTHRLHTTPRRTAGLGASHQLLQPRGGRGWALGVCVSVCTGVCVPACACAHLSVTFQRRGKQEQAPTGPAAPPPGSIRAQDLSLPLTVSRPMQKRVFLESCKTGTLSLVWALMIFAAAVFLYACTFCQEVQAGAHYSH